MNNFHYQTIDFQNKWFDMFYSNMLRCIFSLFVFFVLKIEFLVIFLTSSTLLSKLSKVKKTAIGDLGIYIYITVTKLFAQNFEYKYKKIIKNTVNIKQHIYSLIKAFKFFQKSL